MAKKINRYEYILPFIVMILGYLLIGINEMISVFSIMLFIISFVFIMFKIAKDMFVHMKSIFITMIFIIVDMLALFNSNMSGTSLFQYLVGIGIAGYLVYKEEKNKAITYFASYTLAKLIIIILIMLK